MRRNPLHDYRNRLQFCSRRNDATRNDWLIAGALVVLGLCVFGSAIWTVFYEVVR